MQCWSEQAPETSRTVSPMAHSGALDFLLSERAKKVVCEVLGSSIAATTSIRLERRHQRPGLDDSGVFRVISPAGEHYVILTTARVPAEYATSEQGIYGWIHPQDPLLGGLPEACNPLAVASWLHEESVTLTTLSYRPLRRCVLRAIGSRTHYLKVLSPAKAEALLQRHKMLVGIVPAARRAPIPGIVISAAASGRSLAESYSAWDRRAEPIPSWESIAGLLDALPKDVVTLPGRKAWSDRLDFYADGARALLPHRINEINSVEARIRLLLDGLPRGQVVPSHGDFYEANIFGSARHAHTLIDVDSVGPGYRVDDYACLLGHLAVLPDLSPSHYAGTDRLLFNWTDQASAQVHPASLRARVAGVLLSLSVGAPRDRAEHRLTLAVRWTQEAERFV